MCGLTGLLTDRLRDPTELHRWIGRMSDTLVHRGPDDAGTWIHRDARVAFGFRRLAILDLTAQGHQPMTSASGRFTIVFNGEVYNHGDLRRELLRRGAGFRGNSDTETILAAFEAWGIRASLQRFIGMFAMAVWDESDQSLTLIRDRLGIKPLFVYHRPGHVMFASELKAIMAGPMFDASLNPAAIDAYLRYLYVPAPASIFQYVTKLLPGHTLTLRGTGELPASEPYWSLRDAAHGSGRSMSDGSDAQTIDEVEEVLRDAVRLRLIADVPVGTLLSGGIDSSLITALAQQEATGPLRTYSIGFDVQEFDEAPAAARVARHLGTEHQELTLEGSDMLALIPRLPEIFDEPLANASQLPTYLVAEMARREVTVALAGDGGDEIFGGYHRYIQGAGMIERLNRIPLPARRMVGVGAARVPTDAWDRAYRAVEPILPARMHHRLAGEKLSKMAGLMQQRNAAEMYQYLLSANGQTQEDLVAQLFADHSSAPLLDRMMLADQLMYLPDDLLAKVDRASMAVSLEVRVPLLDHRVVKLSWQLAAHHKIRGSEGKWVLRQLLYRHVPRELVDRPKMGFTVPVAAWLRGPLREWSAEILFADASTDNGALGSARRMWQDLQAGQARSANGVWAHIMLAAWRQRWRV